ncbi:MAG: ATP-binding protein [Kiritimatiellae bacterium]|nr:ATP-binding protein [Kiritimatiellia bacterium]
MHANISDIVLDIVANSIEADAEKIILSIYNDSKFLNIAVEDDGTGMDENTLKKVKDPFFTDGKKHVSRKVGLGIPFVIQTTELCNGSFEISSVLNEGTVIKFSVDLENIDTPPTGDLVSTIVMLMGYPGQFELIVKYKTINGEFEISRTELLDALGDLEDVSSIKLADEYITGLEEDIK